MSTDFSIHAQTRTDTGTATSRRLRHVGLTPAIVYGGNHQPLAITLKHNEVIEHIKHEAFFSHILDLNIDGKTQQVILRDMQRHPAKRQILHLDFQRVSAKDKLHIHVPLHFVNEALSPGIKAGGVASHLLIEIEVVCLPKDLPQYIEVDMSQLEIGQSVRLSDITLPAGVSIPESTDDAIASIHLPHTSEEQAEDSDEEAVEDLPDD